MAFQRQVHTGGFHHLKSLLCIGCWNVHSLVKADSDIKVATVQSVSMDVDKKICFLVHK